MPTKKVFSVAIESLTQTAGRAARNVMEKVIMYADTITESMQKNYWRNITQAWKAIKI